MAQARSVYAPGSTPESPAWPHRSTDSGSRAAQRPLQQGLAALTQWVEREAGRRGLGGAAPQ